MQKCNCCNCKLRTSRSVSLGREVLSEELGLQKGRALIYAGMYRVHMFVVALLLLTCHAFEIFIACEYYPMADVYLWSHSFFCKLKGNTSFLTRFHFLSNPPAFTAECIVGCNIPTECTIQYKYMTDL